MNPSTILTVIHSDYWFDDGNLVLQAETTKFKVHRSLIIRYSRWVRSVVESRRDDSDSLELATTLGATEITPIVLPPQITAAAFSSMLKMIYSIVSLKHNHSQDESIDLLKATIELRCPEMREAVMDLLEATISTEMRLTLGMRHSLERWRLPAFRDLVLEFRLTPAPPASRHGVLADLALALVVAQDRVAKLRITYLTQVIYSSAGPSGNAHAHAKAICAHMSALLLRILPYCRRGGFHSSYLASVKSLGEPGACCWSPSQDQLAACAGPTAAEHETIESIWNTEVLGIVCK